ncbi:MAG: poly(A) polymerase [Parcubacteria bacterium C7867-005]|nr:MAG: poly(A) polymerase [Parcubacteria bacterium C7867-005]
MKNAKIELGIPKKIREISQVLSDAGFENYLVGGCVRDVLMGNKPKDWDIASIASPEQIIGLFPKTFYENEYGTVGVVSEGEEDKTLEIVEVTPYRIESDYSDYRRPDRVLWGKTIEEDLARRDFTINSIAYDIQNKKIVDPFDGQADLDKEVIKTVGKASDRFNEDALRMLRAVRLSCTLGFVIEHETLVAISDNVNLLKHISKERIRDEFIKIIMSDSPAATLDLAMRLGIIKYISLDLEKGVGVEQNQAHAYTVWEHLLRSLEHASKKNFPLYVRLSALFHDIAKPHTKKWQNNQWTFYGHEVVGARITKSALTDLKFPKETIEKVTKLVRWHMFFSDTEEISLSAVRRMVRNVSPELIWDLIDVRTADRIGTGRPKEAPYRLRKYKSMIEEVMRDPISVKQLAVNGNDIMNLTNSKGGSHVGDILEILLSEVLENPSLNNKEILGKKVLELYKMKTDELKRLGKEARTKNESEDEREIEKIKSKHAVR